MIRQKLTVIDPEGLHMRPAAKFVEEMGKYECDVTIIHKDSTVNAKSILSIIAACIKCGAEIEVLCEGSDEAEAMAAAVLLLQSGEN